MLVSLIPMEPGWFEQLAGYALEATVIFAVATVATLALRRSAAALRQLIWTLAMAGVLALPLLSWVVPAWDVPRVAVSTPRQPAAAIPVVQPTSLPTQPLAIATQPNSAPHNTATPTPTVSPTRPQTSPATAQQTPFDWPRTLWLLWLAGVFCLLCRLFLGLRGFRRLENRADPAEYTDELRAAMSALCIRRPVRLLISPAISVPVTWGIILPVLVLPDTAESWSPERRQVVMLHELAHVARGDYLIRLLAQCVCALHWFNPLAWFAFARLCAEQELACDDLVLHSGCKASAYAGHLLAIAQGMSRRPALVAAVPMARANELKARLHLLLDGTVNRQRLTAIIIVALLLLAIAIIVPLAALRQRDKNVFPAVHNIAVLPDGVTIELIGVSHSPFTNRPWWKPDGTPLAKSPFPTSYDYPGATIDPEDKVRTLAFKIDHLPAPLTQYDTYFEENHSHLDLHAGVENNHSEYRFFPTSPSSGYIGMDLWKKPHRNTAGVIRIGLTNARWENVVTLHWVNTQLKFNRTDARTSLGDIIPVTIKMLSPQFCIPKHTNPQLLSCDFSLDGACVRDLYEVRFIAMDEHGGIIPWSYDFESSGPKHFNGNYHLKLNNNTMSVPTLAVQVRPYLCAEFRNVALVRRGDAPPARPLPASIQAPVQQLATVPLESAPR